jgi:hypothetical protein
MKGDHMKDDFLNSQELIQGLKKIKGASRGGNPIGVIAIFLIGAVFGMIGLTAVKSCNKQAVPKTAFRKAKKCSACHNQMAAMAGYFRKAGSKTPEQMATAVLATKSPRLLAAIAKVESGGNPHIRRAGYKKRHDGAFQVNGKYWGKVPSDAAGQALQAEAILAELTTGHGIKKALSVYGGDSSSRYQRTILVELTQVP